MASVNVFVGMALLNFLACVFQTIKGYAQVRRDDILEANVAFNTAEDFGESMIIFIVVALFGMFFV